MILVELGPGHGTLMKDIVRILSKTNTLNLIRSIHLVETSPILQNIQKENLKDLENVFFHHNIDDLPQENAIFLANEFFDAFPIRQFYQGEEVKITLEGLKKNNRDKIIEDSPQTMSYFQKILDFLKINTGIFVIIDYGDLELKGSTLQAIQKHSFVDPFKNPGEADLTAHVNFGNLQSKAQSQGFLTKFTTQRNFLLSLGIQAYSEKLLPKVPLIKNDIHRLISPNEMGNLFKVLIISNNNSI